MICNIFVFFVLYFTAKKSSKIWSELLKAKLPLKYLVKSKLKHFKQQTT